MKKLLTLFVLSLFAVSMSGQQWIQLIENNDLEGTENKNFVTKEAGGEFAGQVINSIITDGVGVDGSRGIQVVSPAGAAEDWDTQFWIVFDEPLFAGDRISVSFDYKASQDATADTQSHGNPGSYQHWAAIGSPNFTTEWQTYERTVTVDGSMAGANGLKSIAFNLSKVRDADVTYYFDNIYVSLEVPKEIVWTPNMILNGDCEADADYGFIKTGFWRDGHEGNVFSFVGREVGKDDNPCIENGVGVDGTRGVAVHSVADALNGWDTQFFITTTHRFTEGEHVIIKFDYRSDDATTVSTQWHELAGDYNFYIGVGDIAFTPEWQHFEKEIILSADQVKDQGGQYPNSTQTLTLNLNDKKDLATTFYFDNIEFYIDRDLATDEDWELIEKVMAGPPTVNPEPAIWTVAGNFVGSSWNPEDAANDMTSTDNVNYSLTKEGVTLEKGVTYEFKVAKDHAWNEAYPEVNYTFTVEETAIYTVTVTFNAETKEIAVTTTKTGDAQAVEHAYSVMGTFGGDSWTIDNDMTKGEDGIYTVTFEDVAAGNYEFKVRVDHDWSVSYPGSNYQVTVDQDGSKVVVTFNEETKEVNATVTAPSSGDPATIWEGDGSAGAVNWNGIYRFALEGHDGANECIAEIPQAIWDKMMTETFYADIQAEDPQVRITTGWWDTNLTANDIQPGNELLTNNGDGTWTVKVNLADNPDLVALLVDHHLLFTGDRYTLLKLYFKDSTGIQTPVASEKAVNGAIYNLSGQKVGASYKGIVIVNGKKVLKK